MARVFSKILLSVLFFVFASHSVVLADENSYFDLAKGKLQRGASNLAFGLAEIPAGIETIGEKHGVGAAATWGILHGTGKAIQRAAVGIFEILTFPVELPNNFEPLLEPQFTEDEMRDEADANGSME